MRNRPGYTLLELTIVLAIAALFASAAAPSMFHARDAIGVRAARAELVAALATTRSAAILSGGATLFIDVRTGSVWIEAAAGTRVGPTRELKAQYDVAIETDRSSGLVTIRYDALGIGRLANATVRVRRGRVTGAVSISAYGRVHS